THGVVWLIDSRTSSAVPSWPSGPAENDATSPRVITMKLVWAPGTNSGSSLCSGIITLPPDFGTRSSPWSKNWPKNVNIRLNGADRPKSGVMFGMNSEPVGSPDSGGAGSPQTNPPDPHGWSCANWAAGLADDWSTIRLLIVRGSESMTVPVFDA